MKRALFLTIPALFLLSSNVKAQHPILTGSMLEKCAKSNSMNEKSDWYCTGFLHGMLGGLRSEREKPHKICLPHAGPSNNKIYAKLLELLEDDPSLRTEKSRIVVLKTLKAIHSCNLY